MPAFPSFLHRTVRPLWLGLLIVAPLHAQTPWEYRQTLASGEAGAEFGGAVAVSGDWLAVGLPDSDAYSPTLQADAGGVMIYRRQPDGSYVAFTPQPLRSQPAVEAGARFGYSLALWGDRLVIGAPYHGPISEGRVEFWEFDSSSQAWEFRVGYGNNHATGLFGFSVAISRDRVAIGEPTYESDGMVPNSGRVHSFVRNAADTFYIPQDTLLPLAPVANGNFGYAVAIADFLPLLNTAPDRLLVGEPRSGAGNAGLAWIYEIEAGAFSFEQLVAPPPGFVGDEFGRTLDISGAYNAIGARDASQVSVVRRDGDGGWSLLPTLAPPASPLSALRFGEKLDLSGNRLLIGHPQDGSLAPIGRAHVFALAADGDGFDFQFSLLQPGGDTGVWDDFGTALAIDGHSAIIAAPHDVVESAVGAGRVAVYFAGRVFRDGFEQAE